MINISVVMPVYNSGLYLKEAIESVRNQTFQDWELLCVDDGSTDELTKEILQWADDFDNRITVVYNSNKGAAIARNVGLKRACGDYVIFLDSDDVFAPDMLEKMYERGYNCDCDLCICGFRSFYEKDGKRESGIENSYTRSLQDLRMSEMYLNVAGTNPWVKLCKRSFLLDYHIWFQNLSSCNDVYYSVMTLLLADKVETMEGSEFVYYRQQTPTQISAHRAPMNLWYAIEYTISDLKIRKVWNDVVSHQIYALLLKSGIHELKSCREDEKRYEFYDKVRSALNTVEIVFDDLYLTHLNKYWRSEALDSGWLNLIGNYYEQIKRNTTELLHELAGAKNILLWGYGKRGQAFAKWGYENGVGKITIYDKNLHDEDIDDTYGNSFANHIDNIWKMDVIIASNTIVYEEALKLEDTLSMGGYILNLEIYCAM